MKNMLLTATLLLWLSPGFAAADENSQSSAPPARDNAAPNGVMGEHSMVATVESINHKTGFIKLRTGRGFMLIHYPPPSVQELKNGDKLTVNLSYSRQTGANSEGMMKMK